MKKHTADLPFFATVSERTVTFLGRPQPTRLKQQREAFVLAVKTYRSKAEAEVAAGCFEGLLA